MGRRREEAQCTGQRRRTALAQPVDLEGGEKEMQQAGVVTRYL
jgi:hypothetical protein